MIIPLTLEPADYSALWSIRNRSHFQNNDMPKNKASLVYSSESGSICPECEQPMDACSGNPSGNPKDGLKTVRVSFSSKGRKGKSDTLIKGLRMIPIELKAYAGKLKKKTGTGDSLKDGVVEIQGHYREKVAEILTKDGWEVQWNS